MCSLLGPQSTPTVSGYHAPLPSLLDQLLSLLNNASSAAGVFQGNGAVTPPVGVVTLVTVTPMPPTNSSARLRVWLLVSGGVGPRRLTDFVMQMKDKVII